MQIAANTMVAIDYTLTTDDGQVFDSSKDREPLSYLHGAGRIIPGLEREFEEKEIGDQLQVTIPSREAFGGRNETLRQEVPRDRLEGADQLKKGMQFQATQFPVHSW